MARQTAPHAPRPPPSPAARSTTSVELTTSHDNSRLGPSSAPQQFAPWRVAQGRFDIFLPLGFAAPVTVDAHALSEPWQVEFVAGGHVGVSDTSKLGLGGAAGLRPHELLEAALASCMTMTARMELHDRGLPDDGVAVQVEVVRETQASRFFYALTLPPELEGQRAVILERLERSPVRTTLSNTLTFDERPPEQIAASAAAHSR